MNLQCLDIVADVISIIGFPTLAITTIQLFREMKRAREEAIKERRPRGVSEDCVSFRDVDRKCAINLVPFKQLAAIPRVGDGVYLPGETDAEKNYGAGKYEVVGVDFHYREDSEAYSFVPATTSAIEITVRRITSLI